MNTDSVVRAEPELNAEHAETIRATLPLVGAHIDEITTAFYRRLFGNHPELIRDLFNRGNQAQGSQQRALAASVAVFATYLVDPLLPHPAAMLSRIGHKHASLGITADQYQVVHDNLFAAIVEVLGADVVTEPVAAAWDRVYWLMADALIDLEKQLYVSAGVEPGDVFRDAVVVHRDDDPAGAAVFTVESADPAVTFPEFLPGQYVSVGVRLPDGARQLRQYSLVNNPGEGRLAFAVKRVEAVAGCPAGEVSNWLHDHIAAGNRLEITLPFGDLTIDTDATTPLVLISAGIGITPMIGALEYLAAHGSTRTILALHADRTPRTHPLADRMRALIARLDSATLELWYQDDAGDARQGLLDLSGITLPVEADIYVCGADGFLDAVRAQLSAHGVPADRIHIEQFTPTDWRTGACPA
ncbi:globin domain-containing protein [Nocardia cyriacigeorgica]|uniref:globin domain-containing protein n=1 Tax=Nocardia cyriacigeorgica TaxID=135487 RepID=UPI00189575F1|nr:globin domain-containing protein [Nocardia cyriacigeorgica]MBF6423651.1 hemin transporter [Nocardia cyriacigeorgica]